MMRYKVCPRCAEKNPETARKCQSCENDLTGVAIIDAQEQARRKQRVEAIVIPIILIVGFFVPFVIIGKAIGEHIGIKLSNMSMSIILIVTLALSYAATYVFTAKKKHPAESGAADEHTVNSSTASVMKRLASSVLFFVVFLFLGFGAFGLLSEPVKSIYTKFTSPYNVWIENVNRQDSPPTIELTIRSKQEGTAQISVRFLDETSMVARTSETVEFGKNERKTIKLPINLSGNQTQVLYKYIEIQINGKVIDWKNR